MMKLWRRRELRDGIRPERVKAVTEFGFTEPQARFVLHVLVYSDVFIERQYRAFTGVSHGQRTKHFLSTIVGRGYATAITPEKLHQGRLFHEWSRAIPRRRKFQESLKIPPSNASPRAASAISRIAAPA